MRGRYILPSFLAGCIAGEFFPLPLVPIPYVLLIASALLPLPLISGLLLDWFRKHACSCSRRLANGTDECISGPGNIVFQFISQNGSIYYAEKLVNCFKTLCFATSLLLVGYSNSQRTDSFDLQVFANTKVVTSLRRGISSSINAFLPDIYQPLKTVSSEDAINVSQNSNVFSAPQQLKRDSELNRGNERAVLRALVLGDKSELSKEIKADFRDSGASHILALSGMHIGIIYSTLMVLLSFLNSHYILYRCKLPLALIFMLLYVLATGLSPSACRAVIMIGLSLWAGLSGRTCNRETPLLLSAFILLLLNPHISRSLSFQLSFAAMAGIVFIFSTIDGILKPSFEFWLSPFNRRSRLQKLKAVPHLALYRLLQICAVSVSCQLATMPLTLYYFGTVPEYFLITNLVASPLVTAIIYVFVMFSVLSGTINLFFSGTVASGAVTSAGSLILYELLHLLNSLMAYIGS